MIKTAILVNRAFYYKRAFIVQLVNNFLYGVPGADDLRLDFVVDA